jgi:hypothetical protein
MSDEVTDSIRAFRRASTHHYSILSLIPKSDSSYYIAETFDKGKQDGEVEWEE